MEIAGGGSYLLGGVQTRNIQPLRPGAETREHLPLNLAHQALAWYPTVALVSDIIGLIRATVAGEQYCSVAKILLSLSEPRPLAPNFGVTLRGLSLPLVREEALKICGLAYTNENVSARVNAFGPLAFCEYCYHSS